LQSIDDGQAELGRARAVHHTMVECDGDVADLCDDYLAVTRHWARTDSTHAQDGDLGVIDDRCLQEAAELTGARDGERRAPQLFRCERAGTRRLGEALDVRA
jgi:hypothetical protein